VEELLRGSAGNPVQPNGVLASGKTYLGLATSAGMYKVAAALLAHGADPNLVDRNGDSPLHVGVRAEHLNVVRLLVDSGAVSGVIDANGTTPLQLAGSDRMRQLLLAAGMGEPLPERGDGDGEEEGSEEEEAADESLSRPSEADGILTNADANARPHGAPPHPKLASGGVSSDSIADLHAASPNVTTVVAASSGPPPIPSQKLGDPAALPSSIVRQALLTELQSLLCSKETNLKRLLMLPSGLRQEVQCDVVRVGKGNTYRCFLRLGGANDRRICIFEASRSRVGKLKNSQYRVTMPSADPRLLEADIREGRGSYEEALEAALYCGKVRSYNLSGANFVVYDDGVKVEGGETLKPGQRPRRQLAALTFNKSSSRRVPMTMRVLVPTVDTPYPTADLLESLQGMPFDDRVEPPEGARLLKLVPPRWNADEQMFQLFCEGRACCMSNKNVQLADTAVQAAGREEAALQVGKLSNSMFNVDMRGVVSPFQAFCSALAVFDQSSVRRRF